VLADALQQCASGHAQQHGEGCAMIRRVRRAASEGSRRLVGAILCARDEGIAAHPPGRDAMGENWRCCGGRASDSKHTHTHTHGHLGQDGDDRWGRFAGQARGHGHGHGHGRGWAMGDGEPEGAAVGGRDGVMGGGWWWSRASGQVVVVVVVCDGRACDSRQRRTSPRNLDRDALSRLPPGGRGGGEAGRTSMRWPPWRRCTPDVARSVLLQRLGASSCRRYRQHGRLAGCDVGGERRRARWLCGSRLAPQGRARRET
jgi:hypothetical protein